MVQRIVALGFEIRVELALGDGAEVWAQLTRAELQRLEREVDELAGRVPDEDAEEAPREPARVG